MGYSVFDPDCLAGSLGLPICRDSSESIPSGRRRDSFTDSQYFAFSVRLTQVAQFWLEISFSHMSGFG